MSRSKLPEEKKKSKISISVDKELSKVLEEFLEDKNVNRSKYIESLIKKDIEERGLKNE